MSQIRVSLLIKNKEKILLMRRIKNNAEYYVLPGGSVEFGESITEAAIREAKEETGLDVVIDKELWQYHNNSDGRDHCCYLVTKYSGQLKLGNPEAGRVSDANKYFLEWHTLGSFNELEFFPEEIKQKVLAIFLDKNR